MKYPTYKPGQRVFVFDNGTLWKGRISNSKMLGKRGMKYLVNNLCPFGAEDYFCPQSFYVHVANIASFNDKKTFSGLVRKYQDSLLKNVRKIDRNISQLYKVKTDTEKEFDKVEELLWK